MKKVSLKSRRIFALGILLLVAPLLLKDWFVIPDFYKGFMMGIGILLEITGVFMIKKEKFSVCSNPS